MSTTKCAFLIIQCDWRDVIWNVGSKVWVSLKHCGSDCPTNHGEIITKQISEDGHPVLESSDGFEVVDITKHSITISHSLYKISARFLAPMKTFSNIHRKSITSLDISDGGGLGVSAATDGSFLLWDTVKGNIQRRFDGHLGDVSTCKFFPSGLVVLSGGMDTQLKIWSAEDGFCARTLNGSHKAGILALCMVERGRNIISCSRDGSVSLWDCGSGMCIGTVTSERSEVNGCDITTLPSKLSQGDMETDSDDKSEVEVGTGGKMLAIACENGCLECIELATRSTLFSIKHRDSLNCCSFINETLLAAGSQDGTILIVDVMHPSSFLLEMRSCESPILSLSPSIFLHQLAFWVSFGNGRCALMRVDLPEQSGQQDDVTNYNDASLVLLCELSGPDCDPVYQVVESKNGFVFTACRDAIVRKYSTEPLV